MVVGPFTDFATCRENHYASTLSLPGTPHLFHNFTQPRKIDEALTTSEPRLTYLEWFRAINVGENM